MFCDVGRTWQLKLLSFSMFSKALQSVFAWMIQNYTCSCDSCKIRTTSSLKKVNCVLLGWRWELFFQLQLFSHSPFIYDQRAACELGFQVVSAQSVFSCQITQTHTHIHTCPDKIIYFKVNSVDLQDVCKAAYFLPWFWGTLLSPCWLTGNCSVPRNNPACSLGTIIIQWAELRRQLPV